MSRIQTLIDQTSFLLDCQKEALAECNRVFEDLLAVVNARAAKTTNGTQDAETISRIAGLIRTQADGLMEEATVDIEFLTEQLETLKKIAVVENPAQAKELLNMIFDENEELKDTATFKQEVLDEASSSKQSLLAMVNDLKDAVNEGSIEEVAAYLESVVGEDADEDLEDDEDEEEGCCDGDDDDCCDDDEDACCDDEESSCGANGGCACEAVGAEKGSCGGCSGCGSSKEGGCGTSSVDLFGSLKDYEQSLLDKADEKTQH